MKKPIQHLVFLPLFLLGASCNIGIEPGEGGTIISASGDNNCVLARCEIDVTNGLKETFTASPSEG